MSTRRTATQPSRAPGAGALREAALRHLARFPATAARLTRVLDRRVERWQCAAEALVQQQAGDQQHGVDRDAIRAAAAAARADVAKVVAALVASRVVDDVAYAEGRTRSLLRAGKSRLLVARHLSERGIATATVRQTIEAAGGDDLAAALMTARRRRIGPFAEATAADPAAAAAGRRRALGILARAGFSHGMAKAALDCDPADAARQIAALRER